MNSNVLYGLGITAIGATVLFFKQKKTAREAEITVTNIDWNGGIDTTILYKDHTGKEFCAEERSSNHWVHPGGRKPDTDIAEPICKALTTAKIKYLTDLKSKIRVERLGPAE